MERGPGFSGKCNEIETSPTNPRTMGSELCEIWAAGPTSSGTWTIEFVFLDLQTALKNGVDLCGPHNCGAIA